MLDFSYLEPEILENLSIENGKHSTISQNLIKDLLSGNLTVLDVIERLKSLLLNTSTEKRELGMIIFSNTLKEIKNLNAQELNVIAAYFCEKLKDYYKVASASLEGTFALISYENIPGDSIIQLLSSIFNHIPCQQQQQPQRFLIYQIYEKVLEKHQNEVNAMGIDFVYGVISSIDGERDPKNLIYLFNWLPIFLKTVKLGHLTEEMFDVLSCYFPVDFKAPTSGNNNITREALAKDLAICLTCISDFSSLGIDLALEKLDSTLKIAKEDSLEILRLGCNNYNTETYNENCLKIWSEIQKIVFSNTDSKLIEHGLETFKLVINKLSYGDEKNFESMIHNIIDTLQGNLLPESKLFEKSCLILIYMAGGSERSSLIVAQRICPLLENTFKIDTNFKHKALILHSYSQFIKAVIKTSNSVILLENIEEIQNCSNLYFQAINHTDTDVIIKGYEGFSEISRHISENVRKIFLNSLRKVLLFSLPYKEAILKTLNNFAQNFPLDVKTEIFNRNKNDFTNELSLDNYLYSLQSVGMLNNFENFIIETHIEYSVQNLNFNVIGLKNLNKILLKFSNLRKNFRENHFICIINFLKELEQIENYSETEFLHNIRSVVEFFIRNCNLNEQQTHYLNYSKGKFKNELIYVTVLSGLIIPLRKGAFNDFSNVDYLLNYSLNSTNKIIGIQHTDDASETLASILNKTENDAVIEDVSRKLLNLSSVLEKRHILLISWIICGLVTRNHKNTWDLLNLLINSLKTFPESAQAFSLILNDGSNNCISKENYCCIMPLYKQKLFIYSMNQFNSMKLSCNENHLIAVGYLIEKAPKLVVVGQFKNIFRLILQCLESSKESKVLEIILQRISEFIGTEESVIEDNLEDILTRVLNLTVFEPAMVVRIAAIKCLEQIVRTYKIYKILPFKVKVTEQLGICVDDKKRLVRKEAMECRSLWYLLDAPI